MIVSSAKKKEYASINRTVLTSMILVPMIPFTLILCIGFIHFRSSIQTGTTTNMQRIVEDHCQLIEAFLEERRSDLELIGNAVPFEELRQPTKLRSIYDHMQKVSQAFVDIGVFDENGTHLAYHGPYNLEGKNYRDADWFKEVLDRGYYISDVFLGYRHVPHFVIAVARRNTKNTWVIRATIDSQLFQTLVDKIRIGDTGEAYIINRQGVLQTRRRSGGDLLQSVEPPPGASLSGRQTESHLYQDQSGIDFLYTVTRLKTKTWYLVVRQEKKDAFRALRSTAFIITVIAVAGGLIIILTAVYLTGRIVWRLQRIDTEKEQLNQQLVGASRLAELGEMAAGFAHEINNPLQIISNEHVLIEMGVDSLRESCADQEQEAFQEISESLSQVKLQLSRCARITQAILKFGRQGEPTYEDIDLNAFVRETTAIVAQKAHVNGILLKENIMTDRAVIHGDASQLQQVLLNLYNNAFDAIASKHGTSGGMLSVETLKKDRGMVEIRVQDNGCGIRKEDAAKVFSPFFTTKPVGQGTGLGLSVCYGIVQKMNGSMEVESSPGAGATFIIHLPITSAGGKSRHGG